MKRQANTRRTKLKTVRIGKEKFSTVKQIHKQWGAAHKENPYAMTAFDWFFGMNYPGFCAMTGGFTPFTHRKLIGLKP